jgi:hypothetical protein
MKDDGIKDTRTLARMVLLRRKEEGNGILILG